MTGDEGSKDIEAAAHVPDDIAFEQQFDPGGLYALRAAVAAHATDLGLREDRVGGLLVTATELATNAIRHGGGRGRLRLWQAGGALYLQVSDDGPGMVDPGTAGTQAVSLTALDGRGLWIVRQLCRDVHIAATTAGTSVTVSIAVGDR